MDGVAALSTHCLNLQCELDAAKVKLEILWQAHKIKQERIEYVEKLKQSPNILKFYKTIQLCIQNMFIRAVSGNVESDKSIQLAQTSLDIFNDISNIAPILGPMLTAFINWTIGKAIQNIDDARRQNVSERISELLTITELKRLSEEVAKRLTDWYKPVLESIATKEQDELFRKDANIVKKIKKIAKKVITKGKEDYSIVKVAKYAIAWGLDALPQLQDKDLEDPSGLPGYKVMADKMVQAITYKQINEEESVGKLFFDTVSKVPKLGKCLQSIKQVVKGLRKDHVILKTGEVIAVYRVFSECGIRIEEENRIIPYEVPNAKGMTSVLGFCNGTKEAVIARNLKELTSIPKKKADEDANSPASTKATNKQLIAVTQQTSQLENHLNQFQVHHTVTVEMLKTKIDKLLKIVDEQQEKIHILTEKLQAKESQLSNEIEELKKQNAIQQQQIQQLFQFLNLTINNTSQSKLVEVAEPVKNIFSLFAHSSHSAQGQEISKSLQQAQNNLT